jgi:hypothetical protein
MSRRSSITRKIQTDQYTLNKLCVFGELILIDSKEVQSRYIEICRFFIGF